MHSMSLVQFRGGMRCSALIPMFHLSKLVELHQSTSISIFVYRCECVCSAFERYFTDCLAGLAWLGWAKCIAIVYYSFLATKAIHFTALMIFFVLATLIQCNPYYMLSLYTRFSLRTHIHLHKYPACIIILFYLFNFYRHLGCEACTNLSLSLSLWISSFLILSRAVCVCAYATYHLSDGDANAILEWEFYRLCEEGIAKSIFVLIVYFVLQRRKWKSSRKRRAIEREWERERDQEWKIVERIL